MSAARIICPGCKTILTSNQAFEPGKMVGCRRCKLLFIVTQNDMATQSTRAEEISAERVLTEVDVSRPYPKPSPYQGRHRYRGLTAKEIGSVFVACGIMLFLAGVVVSIYLLYLSGGRAPDRATPSAPPPRIIAGEPTPAASPTAEVEDDHPPPRKPVPRIEDDAEPRTKK